MRLASRAKIPFSWGPVLVMSPCQELRHGTVVILLLKSCITLRTLNYGDYGIFLDMGNARFISSTVFAVF